MADHTLARQYRDFSNELSTTKVYIPAITVGSIVGVLALAATYEAALDGITIGEAAKSTIVMDSNILSADLPDSEFAQRELKWLVHYHAATLGTKALWPTVLKASVGCSPV